MERSRHFRRGASILPSLFTTGNLFLGFWSIVKTLDGRFAEAAPLVGGAVILDMLDGRIARLTNTQTEFGAQLDSLADAVSFGVAPALLSYCWALSTFPRAGWPAAFLFLLVAAHPEGSLLALTSLYTASGPLAWAVSSLRRRADPKEPQALDEPQPVR